MTIKERLKELDEARNNIRTAKETITKLVYMTEPNKFFNFSSESAMELINCELQSAFDSLEEAQSEECRLTILLNEWENCHDENGKAIQPPNNIDCMTAFLSGDYIK